MTEKTVRSEYPHSRRPEAVSERVLFWLVAICMSFEFAETYGRTLPIGTPLMQYAQGQLEAPFRRRVLTQWLYRGVVHFTGDRPFRGPHAVIPVESMINMGIAFLSVIIIITVTRALIGYFVDQKQLRWASLLSVYMLIYLQIMPTDVRAQFPYDLPAALFFGAATYGALTRNRWIYYPAFLIGTFNKESTVFLVPLLFLSSLDETIPLGRAIRSARRWLYVEMFAGLILWQLLVKFCERISGGPGRGMVHAVGANIHLLLNPRHWITAFSVFGFLWIPCLIYYRRVQPVRVQRCALLLVPWFLVLFRFGDVIEIRTHGEWVVFMTLFVALVVDQSIRFVGRSAPVMAHQLENGSDTCLP